MTPTCTAAPELPPVPQAGRFTTRAQIAAGLCACAGLSAFIFAVDPSRHAVYPQCFFYNATGLYCAGCGATRALHALLHGRILEALHDNALFIIALPVLLFFLGRYVLAAWRAEAWPAIHFRSGPIMRWGVTIILVLAAFMLARNLPGAALEWLRPVASTG